MKSAEDYRQERDVYRKALKDAVAIIIDIVNEECCAYGHEDEINRLELISENKCLCRALEKAKDRNGQDYCVAYGVFCCPGKLPLCKFGMALFPEDEESSTTTNKDKTDERDR